MAIKRVECYVATCDTPDCKPFDGEFTPHFDTEEEAVERLCAEDEWTFDGKVLLCRDCTDIRECERNGHDWWPGGTDPSTGVREEYCGRCHAASRLLATT
ncbi:hypothetical protein Q7689_00140 [Nocardiopsis tropica]|uniref:hypothetical protein n=1 Tax=Nocardiopsis tropica TaxID=109330 RepID=UPI002E8569FF|nr:hypothetical protein [Nocardiopsis tropica]